MERDGFRVAGYDRDEAKVAAWATGPATEKDVEAAPSPQAPMATHGGRTA